MEFFELISKEAAAPLMSVAGLMWFWKFWGKNQNFGFFFENAENYREF